MGQNINKYDTRAGIAPDDTFLPFVIKTEKIQEFLQNKLDTVIVEVNNKLKEGVPKIPRIPIKVYALKLGGYCYTILVTLPNEAFARKTKRKKSYQSDIDATSFNISGYLEDSEDEDTSYEKVYQPIYNVLSPYFFVKPKQTFRSPKIMKYYELTPANASKLIHFASKINVIRTGNKKSGNKVGVIMLDPFAVIHEMLMMADPRKFEIIMNKVLSRKNGTYDFHVTRKVITNNGNNRADDIDEVLRMIKNSSTVGK